MVVVCDVCRDVVHAFSGRIVRHGIRSHGTFHMCIGSGRSYVSNCNDIVARD